MRKKDIQTERMKNYFIEATKAILKGEGLRSVSVRNIADQAGYSYATLYNYFRDVKDLIFYCVRDFQAEMESYIFNETRKTGRGFEKIKAITRTYVKYFIQYPGIFELFFLEKTTDIQSAQPAVGLISSHLDRLCDDEWQFCIRHKYLTPAETEIRKNALKYAITGLLLFYINRREVDSYQEFMKRVDSQIDHVLADS